jgi:SAM-dependent methyltransferase
MDATTQPANEQMTLWNGPSGRAWVEAQELLDGMFQPFEDHLVEASRPHAGGSVLDVGCGTGSTTLAVARRLGGGATAVGVDISAPMLAVARARAEKERLPARFIVADAQRHAFAPGSFDVVVSRFGVMFFDDAVQAFGNLRRAAKGGAELRFVAWRSPADNPFMTTAERAAAPLLPNLPMRRPGPGQFAFADPSHVQGILRDSGWSEVDIEPVDVVCAFPARELTRFLTRLGPLGLALKDADENTRARVIDTVRRAFEPFVHGHEVRYGAACWTVGARAPFRP